MDAMRRENEKTVAVGNMKVNAKGDLLDSNGKIARTADDIAREKGRVQSVIVNSGLKGPAPAPINTVEQKPKEVKKKTIKEIELPSGDIVMEDNNEQS
jgi:hypothetical protein